MAQRYPQSQQAGSVQFPNPLPSQSSIQLLSQELVAAQRRLLQYTDLISNLYAELDIIRSIVCHDCKQRISNLAQQIPTIPVEQSQNIGSLQTTPIISARPTAEATATIPFPGHSSFSPPRNLSDARLTPPLPATLSHSPIIPVISNATTSSEASPLDTAPMNSVKETSVIDRPEKSQWSFTYNSEVKRSIDITFAHEVKNSSPVYAVRFSPDGNLLAVGHSFDQVARTDIYDVQNRSLRCALTEYSGYKKQSRSRGAWCICFSPDGRYLAVVCSLETIYLWEIASKRVVAALKGHVGAVRFLDISPDGRHLVTCSYDYSIRIWSLRDGSSKSLLSTPGYYFISAKFSPNGRYVVASNLDRILRIWDVRSSQLIGRWDGNKESIWSLVFSPDEELLVTGCWDGVVKSWDISSLKEPARSSLSVLTEERMLVQKIEKLDFDGHWGDVRSISISPDGKWIITAASDKLVCVWDLHTAELQCTLEGKVGLWAVDVSPVGNYIATGSDDGFVTLWRYQTV